MQVAAAFAALEHGRVQRGMGWGCVAPCTSLWTCPALAMQLAWVVQMLQLVCCLKLAWWKRTTLVCPEQAMRIHAECEEAPPAPATESCLLRA